MTRACLTGCALFIFDQKFDQKRETPLNTRVMELNVSFQVSPSLLSKNPVKSTFSGFYFLKFCTNGQTYFGGVKGFFTNPLTKILTKSLEEIFGQNTHTFFLGFFDRIAVYTLHNVVSFPSTDSHNVCIGDFL